MVGDLTNSCRGAELRFVAMDKYLQSKMASKYSYKENVKVYNDLIVSSINTFRNVFFFNKCFAITSIYYNNRII